MTQGFSNNSFDNTGHTTSHASKVNEGAMTQYPYYISSSISTANTHSQYYQLAMEEDSNHDGTNDIVVWFCLKNGKENAYTYSPNDVRNNYYFYSKGNVIYTGVGHKTGITQQEQQLFANAVIAAANVTAVEVDEFLEDLAKDYEKIYKENNELREKVSALTENLAHYRTIEESLKRALVLAEETSKETIENATQKAQTLEAEASRNAKELVSQAQAEADKIRTSAKEDFKEEKEKHEQMIKNYQELIRKLESDYQSYKARMKQFINGQMDILNNPVYEMEFQIAGEKKEEEQDKDHEQFGKEQ